MDFLNPINEKHIHKFTPEATRFLLCHFSFFRHFFKDRKLQSVNSSFFHCYIVIMSYFVRESHLCRDSPADSGRQLLFPLAVSIAHNGLYNNKSLFNWTFLCNCRYKEFLLPFSIRFFIIILRTV